MVLVRDPETGLLVEVEDKDLHLVTAEGIVDMNEAPAPRPVDNVTGPKSVCNVANCRPWCVVVAAASNANEEGTKVTQVFGVLCHDQITKQRNGSDLC